ncbi:toxin-antitoxin system YwqK family antitoxin [Xanthomarina sp. F2636L]|uniref:toxin-antitoxin system YwqK family antitoxin n=1 Tax=Xanthomarina sp. F2636L TaxID=2996018 RepID=UPI00225E1698|nr:hypothetical protein [Xanthomarina sp. F2636L]MCX7552130.1 hypothetical protein [Xanthomarina sp. F2636L]
MKKIPILFFLLSILSCSDKEVDLQQIVNRNELAYLVNENNPFSGKVISKLQNEQILISGYYKNGKKDGEWIENYNNGQIKKREEYKEGLFNGTVENYSKDGTLLNRKNYLNNNLNGLYLENYENGNPKTSTTYNNNQITSNYKSYYQNGNKELEYTIKNGSFDEDYIEYNDDGSIHKQYYYSNDNKINKGSWKKYWKNDVPVKQSNNDYSTVVFDSNGKPSESVKFYYKNGNLKSEGFYSSIEPDIREGEFKWYYFDGSLKKKTFYKDNNLDGKAESYFLKNNYEGENNLHERVNFKNGKLHGKLEVWDGPSQREKIETLVRYHNNLTRPTWWKIEGECINGFYEGDFKVWWRYVNTYNSQDYKITPVYVLHRWSKGKQIDNGYDSRMGAFVYYTKNGDKMTRNEAYRSIK